MDNKLNLEAFENAINQLRDGLDEYADAKGSTLMRDGVIQRFEFVYELTHKMLRRYLEITASEPSEIDKLSFPNLIRTANEQDLLLSNWEVWRDYRQARTDTSHTYDEKKALGVLKKVPKFLEEAEFLLARLKERITS
jgi:nucleotidyltransferase substrate binding protein (TIGR01987 family)